MRNFRLERCKRLGPELGTVVLLNQTGEVRVGGVISVKLVLQDFQELETFLVRARDLYRYFHPPKTDYLQLRTSNIDRDPQGAQQGQV